jgi:hypothetical protein
MSNNSLESLLKEAIKGHLEFRYGGVDSVAFKLNPKREFEILKTPEEGLVLVMKKSKNK